MGKETLDKTGFDFNLFIDHQFQPVQKTGGDVYIFTGGYGLKNLGDGNFEIIKLKQ